MSGGRGTSGMSRLVLSDIRMQASMWVWTLACAVVGAACSAGSVIAMFTAVSAARTAGDARMVSASIALGGNIVFFTVLAAVGVVASTVGLTLTAQRREHALWVILGIPRRRVRSVLRAELVVLGTVAGALAVPLAPFVANIALAQWTATGLDLHGATAGLQLRHIGACLPAGVVPCLLGGWGVTRRAARTPEMRAFRDHADPPARPGVARSVLALCLLAGVLGMWIPGLGLELEGGIEQRTAFAFAGNLFLICLLLLMGPWVLTPLMRLWTALVPSRGVAWHLAVQSCRTRAARSVTTVLPFALSLSFIALFMTMGSVMPGSTAGLDDVMTVLGWVFVVSWSGGLAVIALVGRERTRDSAVVAVAGARPGVTTRSTVYEGVIYAGTAIVFSAVFLAVASTTIAVGARVGVGQVLDGLPWATLGALAAVTLVTTCLALALQAARVSRTVPARALRS
ncbi:ABC transporter permease [Streptomyces anulatus]|uniref:FtsX-like permease family protein n=2 Tax=Streptomyces anulatus TaxID=1892 RepID=UPI00225A3324|nr:FtsX-like permease family protein [Streptomyces anulatus]MCX4482616.1 ABC transporter permease [Streptomyces anulatus]WSI75601.1 ABC transporter permease [Streptomyces anulatus]WSU71667.1 ABC transporter permease [Streptomyces anulatus]